MITIPNEIYYDSIGRVIDFDFDHNGVSSVHGYVDDRGPRLSLPSGKCKKLDTWYS